MKKSTDFYKVINAVINTLNHGNSVAYVTGGQGGSGYGTFDSGADNDTVRESLLSYAGCEELDDDELTDDWKDDDRKSGFDFWQLSNYGDSAAYIQLAIDPDMYVTSYELRDMISDDTDMECAEITTGINGYPRGLRGCVLIDGEDMTWDELQKIAERYGVEIVELHKRDGWQLWECRGTAFGMFDFADYQSSHDDNFKCVDSWEAFAQDIREFVQEVIRDYEHDEDAAARLEELANEVEQKEPLGSNEFISWEYNDYERYEVQDRMVDHFSYDTHNYALAFDCMIAD